MYHSHLPGEMARIWQVGAVARTNRHERIRRATLLGGILGTLQYLGTAPFVLHRMFVRFSQPFAFSALVLFWQIIVSNQLYAIIAGAIIAAFAFYCVYMYYVDKHINSSIKPLAEVSAEYPDEPSEEQEDSGSAPARDRTISHDGLPLNMPVLDSNFDAVFSRRPFGSKSNNSSDSESYTRLTVESATKKSAAKPAEPVKAEKAPESAAASETKGGKSNVSRTGPIGGYASSSALSSEDLPSDLDKPSRRNRAHIARATRSKQRAVLSGRDSRKESSKQPGGESDSVGESEAERRRRRKKEKKQKGRGRTHSDMSVESIPEGDREEEDSCSSSEEEEARRSSSKARSKSNNKTRREKEKKGRGKKDGKKEGKSKHRRHRHGSSSDDDSHSSDDARFSHSDSSEDTSSSGEDWGREAAKRAIKRSRGNSKEAKV
jgi:Ca2+/Na+ antiporter